MAHGNDASGRLAKRPLQRRDAAENRARLLDAARKVFAAHGPNAPFDEIARAAGVSRTTLYRNFTTREELAAAVYEDNVLQHEEHARSVLGQPDGVVTLYNQVLESAVRHRGSPIFTKCGTPHIYPYIDVRLRPGSRPRGVRMTHEIALKTYRDV